MTAADGGPRHDRSDAGFTIVELLVTMLLIGIVSAVVAGVFQSSMRALNDNDTRLRSSQGAQVAMENMTRSLRNGAPVPTSTGADLGAVSVAEPRRITVHSATAARPVRITYAVDADGRLTETRIQGTAGTGGVTQFTSAPTTRVLLDGVVNTPADPVFTYLDASGQPLPEPANPFAVQVIRVTLDVRVSDNASVAPHRVTHQLLLRNLVIDQEDP